MRVLYFTDRDSPHDRRFLRALAGSPYQVYSLRQYECHPDTPPGITELVWPEGQPDWSCWHGWQGGKEQFLKIVDQVRPGLVHAGPVQGPALLAALAGYHPLVTMSWGSDLLLRAKRSPWMRGATRYTLERTDVFVGDCQTVADEAAAYGMARKRVVLFPWGVDLKYFSPETSRVAGKALREELGWQDQFVILCNRFWSSIYGVTELAEAFVQTASENSKLRLLLVGDGPQADKIYRILGPVRSRVHFPGWVGRDKLPGFYGAADLFVSPSHSDGSSVSLLEALACGLPVLVSDIPGNQEWVAPGKTGDLFQTGAPQSLRDKILEMAAAPQLATFSRNARELAEDRADWDQNFQRLLEAYARASE
jgi:glycosyltransferase involved in cell wall biosynthesis